MSETATTTVKDTPPSPPAPIPIPNPVSIPAFVPVGQGLGAMSFVVSRTNPSDMSATLKGVPYDVNGNWAPEGFSDVFTIPSIVASPYLTNPTKAAVFGPLIAAADAALVALFTAIVADRRASGK